MSQKQSASAWTCILVVFILKWEEKTSSHLEIISFIYREGVDTAGNFLQSAVTA